MAAVLHHSTAKGTAKLVLVGIANHEGDGGAYPSVETLARYAGVHPRGVQKAIGQLVGKGELRVEYQQGGDRDTPDHERTNRYVVLVACPPWCDRTTRHRDTRRLAGRQLGLHLPVDKGVAHTPGGGASATGGGGASATQTTQPTHPPSLGTAPQDARPCRDCGQGQPRCTDAQRHWHPEDRHTYRPAEVRHATG